MAKCNFNCIFAAYFSEGLLWSFYEEAMLTLFEVQFTYYLCLCYFAVVEFNMIKGCMLFLSSNKKKKEKKKDR